MQLISILMIVRQDVTQSLTKIFVSAAENNSDLMLSSIALNNEDTQIALDLLQLIVVSSCYELLVILFVIIIIIIL